MSNLLVELQVVRSVYESHHERGTEGTSTGMIWKAFGRAVLMPSGRGGIVMVSDASDCSKVQSVPVHSAAMQRARIDLKGRVIP